VHERTPHDDLLLLACDGLWDVMTTAEAVAHVRELYESGETSIPKIAEEMLDIALNKGKTLETSYMVLSLGDSPGACRSPTD
jgi:protein phosphatase 1B